MLMRIRWGLCTAGIYASVAGMLGLLVSVDLAWNAFTGAAPVAFLFGLYTFDGEKYEADKSNRV